MKRPLLLAALLGGLLPAVAQDEAAAPFTLEDYKARVEATVAACDAAPTAGDCRVQLQSVLSSTVDALTYLGYNGSYDLDAPLLRQMSDFPAPEIQAAALYALARLGPKTEDMPALRAALLSDVPAVRRAALGTLKLIADDSAQQLVKRAGMMPSGSGFGHDALPFDPDQAGIAWPAGAQYLHFQSRLPDGTYGFIAKADVATMVAGFEAAASAKATGMGEIEARFGSAYGDLIAPWIERNATLGAVQAIVLKDSAAPNDSDPVRLVLVYEDYALGAPGFALVSLPAVALPRLPRAEPAAPAKPQGEAAIWWSTGNLAAKDGAADDDTAAWRAVIDADGAGASDYLAAFPNGAWRSEAEALLAAPSVTTDQDVYAETDTIRVSWRGLQAGVSATLALGRESDDRVSDSQASNQVDITTPEGSADLSFYSVIEPGVYEVRIVGADNDVLAATSVRIAVATVTVAPDRESYKRRETVTVVFKGMSGNTGDMVSVVKQGTPPEEQGSLRIETGGVGEGTVTFEAPDEPGDYEIRAWYGRDPRLRGHAAFTVRGPDLPPELAPGTPAVALAAATFPANEKVAVRYAGLSANGYIYIAAEGAPASAYLGYVDAKGPDGLVEIALPSEPGAYEVRAIVANEIAASAKVAVTAPEGVALATLSLTKTVFAPGETIEIDFSGMSGASNDYIAIAEAGAPYRRYESHVYIKGQITGRVELTAPNAPGTYEIRVFFKEDPTVLHAKATIAVEAQP